MKFDFIFVVLVYRNTGDLEDFFANFRILNSKVVVVNSFYDDVSEGSFKKIAEDNGADFISVPNKGYGAGNNRGVEYAFNNYEFNYLVISNADIIIEDLKLSNIKKYGECIIAPDIRNVKGKRQNPSCPFRPSRIKEKVRYELLKGYHYKLIWVMFVLSRLSKILYHCIKLFKKTIFSAHGAFLIMPKSVVEKLIPIYDENMFLFNEEEYLGRLAESKSIKTYYAPDIKIFHKEDGSMNIASVNQMERTRQSYMVYYEKWINYNHAK